MLNCFIAEWTWGECSRTKGKKCSLKGKVQIPPAHAEGLKEWNALLKRKDVQKKEIRNFKIACGEGNGRMADIKASTKQNRKIFCQAISKEGLYFQNKNNWS